LGHSTSPSGNPEAVWNCIRSFPFDEGWLCLTNHEVPLYSCADLKPEMEKGTILSGELAKRNKSLHIRQSGIGWIFTQYSVSDGEGCLMLREEFISTENGQRDRLKYDVYWRLEGGSYRPWAARFTGFIKGGDK
jgi:hypothetical protein